MKNSLYSNRNIIAIDLKSFFASVECTQRGLDPFTTALVVCDPIRNGAITLAVTPFLKNLGVPSRGRAYDLPKNIKIFKAPPSMSLYIQKSREVLSIYLEYVAKEDIHVYSIDEVFLDVTDYLHMYNMTDYELAQTIINDIKKRTGLTTTAELVQIYYLLKSRWILKLNTFKITLLNGLMMMLKLNYGLSLPYQKCGALVPVWNLI